MEDFAFGANILDSLTTGMYKNPLVLYREYIQNACDSIDKAVELNILENQTHGEIEITIDDKKRVVEIQDNGVGIPASDFKRVLGNIADSEKTLGEDKGFRGIGRLCGLAYCSKLRFYSKAKGESTVSIMTCDASKMRNLLTEHQTKQKRYLASEILEKIYSFNQDISENIDDHFFRVKLEDVDVRNNELIDVLTIKDYLSFVAPVPYQNSFYFRNEIYKQANSIGSRIDEYSVYVNGEPLFKKYMTSLKDKNGNTYDKVSGVFFRAFHDESENLIAWMWVGVCQFENAIPKNNTMRGIRLRTENIQIGDEDALQKLFKEDRGNSYFIGEVFAIDKELIPNSQRDYFNQNQARDTFETELKRFFNDDLYKVYYNASTMNSGFKKIEKFKTLERAFKDAEQKGFAGFGHRQSKEKELEDARREAEKAKAEIEKKMSNASNDSLFGQVASIIQKTKQNRFEVSSQETVAPTINERNDKQKTAWRTDRLSKLNKQERKLVGRIFEIIFSTVEHNTAERIVQKIEEEFK